jgi:hypothetical protein
MSHADVIRELTGMWNTGDLDSAFIVFSFRDGKIAVLEWFADRDTAVAAARGA